MFQDLKWQSQEYLHTHSAPFIILKLVGLWGLNNLV